MAYVCPSFLLSAVPFLLDGDRVHLAIGIATVLMLPLVIQFASRVCRSRSTSFKPLPSDKDHSTIIKCGCVRIAASAAFARAALAQLKEAGRLLPNQAVLINTIPLLEARASSEIENIVTTQDALFQAALDENRVTDLATREVLRYRTALRRGFESVQSVPFRLRLLEDLCGVLRNEKVSFRTDDGVYIGAGHVDAGVQRAFHRRLQRTFDDVQIEIEDAHIIGRHLAVVVVGRCDGKSVLPGDADREVSTRRHEIAFFD